MGLSRKAERRRFLTRSPAWKETPGVSFVSRAANPKRDFSWDEEGLV